MEDRRDFLKGATASLLGAASYRQVLGANDRVRVGFIGIGLIGKRHLLDFLSQPDVEVAAICEVYEPRLQEGIVATNEKQSKRAEGFKDFRRMYERKDIDAIVVSTPDHWHALQSILACAAGQRPLRTTAIKKDGYEQVRDQFVPHVRNFLDCIKSRQQPVSDVEGGHKTAVACHLANIALKLGRTIRWDDAKEEIIGDREAAKLLVKEYRAPWDRELRAALSKGGRTA